MIQFDLRTRRPKLAGSNFHLSAGGIGDTIVGLYAACGLVEAGHEVGYHAKNIAWLSAVEHPNLRIVPFEKDSGYDRQFGIDANADYFGQMRAAAYGQVRSRAQWYCDSLARALKIPIFAPARPKTINKPHPVLEPGYVVIGPFSHGKNRQWALERWKDLAGSIIESGLRVVVLGHETDSLRLQELFGSLPVDCYCGPDPFWILSAIAHADHFYGLDSGLTHAAGLMETPATAVVASLTGEFLFDCAPSVRTVVPDREVWPCTGCGFIHERGYGSHCETKCDAMNSIPVERVNRKAIPLEIVEFGHSSNAR